MYYVYMIGDGLDLHCGELEGRKEVGCEGEMTTIFLLLETSASVS